MPHLIRHWTKLLGFLFFSLQLPAQNNKGVISGKLMDSSGKHPIALATVTVFKATDTSIITYRLSDPDGNFKVPGLPMNVQLRAVITSSGLSVYRKEFKFSSSQMQVDIGVLKMQPDIKSLDEVLVYSERPPVSVKNDTIEFNASAFKTLPQALVEDLLKKLPGVDVDPEGNITVNGRRVNRLLVDGKEFFGGDPAIATRNLPANLVDKVQVSDDKEELDRNPNINKADLGQVINLKLKRSIKQGWFGKAYAGAGGNSDRTHYESGAIINSFRDTFQVSVLGYSNNINRAGFGFDDLDKIGGYRRSGMNSVGMGGGGGDASIGSTGGGIQRSTGAGININHDPTKKLNLSFQYFFGQNITDYKWKNNTQQFIADTILNSRSAMNNKSRTNTHRIGTKIMWQIDSFTSITFRPGITFRKTNSNSSNLSEGASNFNPKLNESDNQQKVSGNDVNFNYDLNFNKRFKKKGRSFFAYSSLYYGNNSNDQYNIAENVFYNNPTTITVLNQDRRKRTNNLRTNVTANFREMLNKKWAIRVSENLVYYKDNDDLKTFEWDPIAGKYQTLNDDLSNKLSRRGIKSNTTINLEYFKDKLNLTPGISLQSINIKNGFSKIPTIQQKYFFVFPSLFFYYNSWNGGYSVNVNEPSAYDLQPVVDNTNPLYQNFGNTELQPTIYHVFSMGYNKYDNKKLLNYGFRNSFGLSDNTIVRERNVDSRGVQTTKPVNIDGVWYTNTSFDFTKQYKFKNNLRFSLRPNLNFNLSRNFMIVNTIKSSYRHISYGGSITWAFNWKDLIEFNERYTVGKQLTRYENDAFRDLNVISHFSTTELVIRMPKNWVWETTVDYRYNPQTAPGFSKNVIRWNAGINYLFLKQKKGVLRLYIFDILKQNSSAYRFVRDNYIQDVESNALTRFFILSFTYNIRDFKGGKVGGSGRNNFFKF